MSAKVTVSLKQADFVLRTGQFISAGETGDAGTDDRNFHHFLTINFFVMNAAQSACIPDLRLFPISVTNLTARKCRFHPMPIRLS
jgi:hypothetical protein